MRLCSSCVQRPKDCKNDSFGLAGLASQFTCLLRRARFSAACKWRRLAFTASVLLAASEAGAAGFVACLAGAFVTAASASGIGFFFGAADLMGLGFSSLVLNEAFVFGSVLTVKYLRSNWLSVGRSATEWGLNGKRLLQTRGTTASLTISLIKLPLGCSCCSVKGRQKW